ncbi:adenylate/guanylate cyclase domain-containing protein [Iamia majanohamensis]|uniref:Adenylate/guanylate cyclase domain-containing protein n=1 Tax=Iamia majanohamensis TaxID=467976 RepID=A0AAF0BVS8_9ACTN|nr:adenylate/guanylate cyclase domain-containing protein [Iamia majanohamensis]WCO67075.1 adenylate/guanylate cyclase domain-containing protein [Iamia majanohamensis]
MRVDRAFAFVDLCGFTAFAEHNGDERAVLVLAELRSLLREVAARRGVRVVKWLGDGAMLSSTMPDAVAAMVVEADERLAQALPSLALRAGMDNGPVIMFEGDDYIGRPVNVAARLCDAARAHEVLATELVATTLPSWIGCEEVPRLHVRGIEGPLALGRLRVADAGPEPRRDPVCGLTLPAELMVASDHGEHFCSVACATSTRRLPVPN